MHANLAHNVLVCLFFPIGTRALPEQGSRVPMTEARKLRWQLKEGGKQGQLQRIS
jgi:hypothetical protein